MSVGNTPLQPGPATSVPVQRSMPDSGIVVEPDGAPPVGIVAGAVICEDGFSAM
ncbi:MAG: hypothetical protein IPF66_05730 [Holophagales bacterium]|nr:hypothetical protein [Holophagales bacterium]